MMALTLQVGTVGSVTKLIKGHGMSAAVFIESAAILFNFVEKHIFDGKHL